MKDMFKERVIESNWLISNRLISVLLKNSRKLNKRQEELTFDDIIIDENYEILTNSIKGKRTLRELENLYNYLLKF